MADISDVENALLLLLTQAAYPNGTSSPSAVLDGSGSPHAVQLYRGWPMPDQLDTDMERETVDVSIFPTNVELNVTRYTKDWRCLPLPAPTLELIAQGNTLTVAGTVSTPQNVAVVVRTAGGIIPGGDFELEGGGGTLNTEDGSPLELESSDLETTCRFAYSYAVQANDTLTSIATALAAMINADTPATSSGAVITVPAAVSLSPRVGVVGTAVQEISRQKRNVMVSMWCPTPDLRDNAAKLFDVALKQNEFLTMPDGTAARLIYMSSPVIDRMQKENVYRRDLIYSVEYGTTVAMQAPTVTVLEVNLTDLAGNLELEGGGTLDLEGGGGPIELERTPIETIYI